MFETAELGRKLGKKEYEAEVPKLRTDLLTCLQDLKSADFPVIVVLSGNDVRGCNLTLNVLHEWMDPRYLEANAFPRATREERERPFFWRFWNTLPPHGRVGLYIRGWTKDLLSQRLRGKLSALELTRMIQHVIRFEEGLTDDGALLLKFWTHLPPAELERRLKAKRADREEKWRLTDRDVKSYRNFERGRDLVEEVIRETSRGSAPWHVVESGDDRYRNLTIGRMVLDRLRARLAAARTTAAAVKPEPLAEDPLTILDHVDLGRTVERSAYEKQLQRLQGKLHRLSRTAREQGLSTVLVFEGWDAAGKGGAIRRLTTAMDAEGYRVHNIAAPTEDERAHHYLWRFWKRLPRGGHMAIFDRSWYGRVLVERVEGFAGEEEWRRAYAEINDFEAQLLDHGMLLLKFWIHIDREEQLKRFEARKTIPFKQYKITEEDFRNRKRWNDYELAAGEMVGRTSTSSAPWVLVPGNDKKSARLEVLRTVVRGLQDRLD